MKNKHFINFFTGFVKITGIIPAIILFKPKVHYINKKSQSKRLPRPCILVSNHKSLMDFVLYLAVFPFRTIRFLMAEVLFNKGKLFAKFLYSLGGIRVDRDAFTFDFVSDSLSVLDNGGTLGIFPEGRLPINGKPWPFTVSTAFIATHTDAAIVPVYTDGNYGIFKRANIMIGEKLYLKDYCNNESSEDERLNELTALLEKKVYELKDELEKRKAKK